MAHREKAPNQEEADRRGAQEPEQAGVGAVCTAHGLENSPFCTDVLLHTRPRPRGSGRVLRAASATGDIDGP